jgi:hypothetical protein
VHPTTDTACVGGQHCDETTGGCACSTGLSACGGKCTNVSSDVDNCGGCGTSCKTWATSHGLDASAGLCVAGHCGAMIAENAWEVSAWSANCSDMCKKAHLSCPGALPLGCDPYRGPSVGCPIYASVPAADGHIQAQVCPVYGDPLSSCTSKPNTYGDCYFSSGDVQAMLSTWECFCD